MKGGKRAKSKSVNAVNAVAASFSSIFHGTRPFRLKKSNNQGQKSFKFEEFDITPMPNKNVGKTKTTQDLSGNFAYSTFNQVGKLGKGEDVVLTSSNPITLFAVFDGHRNKTVANFCETNFATILTKNVNEITSEIHKFVPVFKNHEEASKVLTRSFEECHEKARDHFSSEHKGGCTAVVLIVYFLRTNSTAASQHFNHTASKETTKLTMFARAANAGDSRCVICTADGSSVRLTVDHKANVKSEVERVKASGCSIGLGKLKGILSITRGIGDFDFEPGFIPTPHVSDPVEIIDSKVNNFKIPDMDFIGNKSTSGKSETSSNGGKMPRYEYSVVSSEPSRMTEMDTERDMSDSEASDWNDRDSKNETKVQNEEEIANYLKSAGMFAIVASDGIWDIAPDATAIDIVRRDAAINGFGNSAEALGKFVDENRGFDDTSCIVVSLKPFN